MPTPFAPHRVSVCLVAVPEMATGVLNGLFEVFSFVGTGWELLTGWPTGPRRFLAQIVAEDRTPFRNLAGLPVAPDLSFAEAKRADIVIVGDLAVGRDEETRGRWPAEVDWLRLLGQAVQQRHFVEEPRQPRTGDRYIDDQAGQNRLYSLTMFSTRNRRKVGQLIADQVERPALHRPLGNPRHDPVSARQLAALFVRNHTSPR